MRPTTICTSLLCAGIALLPSALAAIHPVVQNSALAARSTYSSVQPSWNTIVEAQQERQKRSEISGTTTTGAFAPSKRSEAIKAAAARHVGRRVRRDRLDRRAAAPIVSPTPTTYRGVILVTDTSTGSSLGFIAPSLNDYGEYGPLVASASDALIVSFTADLNSPTDLNQISLENNVGDYEYLGAAVGYDNSNDNLGANSANYVYLVEGGSTSAGATPQADPNSFTQYTGVDADYESSIFSYEPRTRALGLRWVNTNGDDISTFATLTEGGIVFTGDLATFTSTYNGVRPISLSLQFV